MSYSNSNKKFTIINEKKKITIESSNVVPTNIQLVHSFSDNLEEDKKKIYRVILLDLARQIIFIAENPRARLEIMLLNYA